MGYRDPPGLLRTIGNVISLWITMSARCSVRRDDDGSLVGLSVRRSSVVYNYVCKLFTPSDFHAHIEALALRIIGHPILLPHLETYLIWWLRIVGTRDSKGYSHKMTGSKSGKKPKKWNDIAIALIGNYDRPTNTGQLKEQKCRMWRVYDGRL